MKTKTTIKNQTGASAVEFAIVLPLLVLLFMGICEFGLLWYNSQVIVNSSREGARAGIAQWKHADGSLYSDDQVRNLIDGVVQNYCSTRLVTFDTNNPPVVTSTWTSRDFGQDVTVQVTYTYHFLVPSIFHLGTKKILIGRTLMKMENII